MTAHSKLKGALQALDPPAEHRKEAAAALKKLLAEPTYEAARRLYLAIHGADDGERFMRLLAVLFPDEALDEQPEQAPRTTRKAQRMCKVLGVDNMPPQKRSVLRDAVQRLADKLSADYEDYRACFALARGKAPSRNRERHDEYRKGFVKFVAAAFPGADEDEKNAAFPDDSDKRLARCAATLFMLADEECADTKREALIPLAGFTEDETADGDPIRVNALANAMNALREIHQHYIADSAWLHSKNDRLPDDAAPELRNSTKRAWMRQRKRTGHRLTRGRPQGSRQHDNARCVFALADLFEARSGRRATAYESSEAEPPRGRFVTFVELYYDHVLLDAAPSLPTLKRWLRKRRELPHRNNR